MSSQDSDYLKEHQVIDDQKFSCMSFLADPQKKSKICGIKIWGNYKTYDQACIAAEKFRDMEEGTVPVYVGEVGKWCPFNLDPDDTSKVDDVDYKNKELNSLMKAQKDSKLNAELAHNLRKNEQINKIYEDDYKQRKTNLKDMKDNLEKLDKDIDGDEIIKKAQETIEQYENEMKKLKKKQKQLEKDSIKLKSKITTNENTIEVRESLLDEKSSELNTEELQA